MRTQCDKICHGFATPYESSLRDLKLFNNENADIPSVKPGDMDSLKQAVEHYQK